MTDADQKTPSVVARSPMSPLHPHSSSGATEPASGQPASFHRTGMGTGTDAGMGSSAGRNRSTGQAGESASGDTVAPSKAAASALRRRAPRSDKGQIRLTQRDQIVLRWIGEQYAVRLDQLQTLLVHGNWTVGQGEHSQTEVTGNPLRAGLAGGASDTPSSDPLSLSRTHHVVARWRQAGLVQARKLLAYEPLWVWLTPHGLQEAGLPFPPYVPTAAALEHLREVNYVRLAVEARHPEVQWQSERHLRVLQGQSQRGAIRPHVPDALLVPREDRDDSESEAPSPERPAAWKTYSNEVMARSQRRLLTRAEATLAEATTEPVHSISHVVAVEVELSLKSPERLATILGTLTAAYRSVWYFAGPAVASALLRARTRLPTGARSRMRVYDLAGRELSDDGPIISAP